MIRSDAISSKQNQNKNSYSHAVLIIFVTIITSYSIKAQTLDGVDSISTTRLGLLSRANQIAPSTLSAISSSLEEIAQCNSLGSTPPTPQSDAVRAIQRTNQVISILPPNHTIRATVSLGKNGYLAASNRFEEGASITEFWKLSLEGELQQRIALPQDLHDIRIDKLIEYPLGDEIIAIGRIGLEDGVQGWVAKFDPKNR